MTAPTFPCDLVSADGDRHPHAQYVAYLTPNCCRANPWPYLMCTGCAAAVRGDLSTASIQCNDCRLRARTVLVHLTDLRVISATVALSYDDEMAPEDLLGQPPLAAAEEAAQQLAPEVVRLHDAGWDVMRRQIQRTPCPDGERVTVSAAMCRLPA